MSSYPLCGGELGALTESGKILGVRSFYSTTVRRSPISKIYLKIKSLTFKAT
jgi:hypothetical protein